MDGVTLYIDHGSATTRAVLKSSMHPLDQVILGPDQDRSEALAATESIAPLLPPAGNPRGPAPPRSEDRDRILSAVWTAATAQAAGRIDRVVVVVGAHRGPQWRAELRRSATHAGMPTLEFVDGPAAIVRQLAQIEPTPPLGTGIVICDLGASAMEAAVFIHTAGGYEMRSVVDHPSGGDAIDAAIVDEMRPDDITIEQAQTAKHALASRARVTVNGAADGTMVDIDLVALTTATQPVWDGYAATIQTAIAGADAKIASIAAVHLIGGGANLPLAAQALRERIDVPVLLGANPDIAAVMAAASSDPTQAPDPLTTPAPPARNIHLHEVLGIAAPGAAALVLFFQFLAAATPYPLTGNVIGPWGNLGLAAILTLACALFAASAITTPSTDPDSDIGKARAPAVTAAAVSGLIIAVIYGVVAQAYIALDAPYLRVVLLSTVPLAAVVVGLAHLPLPVSKTMSLDRPQISWQQTISVSLAGIGAALVAAGNFGTIDIAGHDGLAWALLERAGGALLGSGFAVLISRRRPTLLYTVPGLALTGTLATTYRTSNTLTFLYVAALTIWIAAHAIPRLPSKNSDPSESADQTLT